MAIDARLRISISTGEIEIEGSQDFVNQYDVLVRSILTSLAEAPAMPPRPVSQAVETSRNAATTPDESNQAIPEFGEAMHRLPKGTSGTDAILVAGYYAARRTADKVFATADANKLLIEQGVKLSNASQSLKSNMEAKRVFKVGSNFRLSREGLERVAQLLGLSGAVS